MDEELIEGGGDVDAVADVFLKSLEEQETKEEESQEEAEEEESQEESEDGSEDEADEASELAEEGEEGSESTEGKTSEAADEAEVTVTIDGKEVKTKVKDLKRLAGQEAEIAWKAESLNAQRRVVETQGMYLAQLLTKRYEDAVAKAAKFKDVDLFVASRELEPAEFDNLRAAKEAAESEVKALEAEGREFIAKAQEARVAVLREQAKEALKVITKAIPDWNDQVYSSVRTYAVAQGMDPDAVNEIVDPGAILMIHKAMKYDELQAKKTEVTKKVIKGPKKVLKKSDTTDASSARIKALQKEAAESGDVDAVAALFLEKSK